MTFQHLVTERLDLDQYARAVLGVLRDLSSASSTRCTQRRSKYPGFSAASNTIAIAATTIAAMSPLFA